MQRVFVFASERERGGGGKARQAGRQAMGRAEKDGCAAQRRGQNGKKKLDVRQKWPVQQHLVAPVIVMRLCIDGGRRRCSLVLFGCRQGQNLEDV